MPRTPELVTVLNAVTATNTPEAIPMSDVNKATLSIVSDGTFNARSGVVTVTVSNDGKNYVAYNMLIPNSTNTSSQNLTRVASTTAINSTRQVAIYGLQDLMPFNFIKVLLTVTDGGSPTGNFTVQLYKQFA